MSVEFKCPSCGKKQFEYEMRIRKYGNMVGRCKSCGAQYLDPRKTELAITGIPEDEYQILPYGLLVALGVFFVWRGLHLFTRFQLGVPSQVQWLMPSVILILGVVLIVGGIYEILLIKTGGKVKKMQRLYEESRQRLCNPEYVQTLRQLGVELPEEL